MLLLPIFLFLLFLLPLSLITPSFYSFLFLHPIYYLSCPLSKPYSILVLFYWPLLQLSLLIIPSHFLILTHTHSHPHTNTYTRVDIHKHTHTHTHALTHAYFAAPSALSLKISPLHFLNFLHWLRKFQPPYCLNFGFAPTLQIWRHAFRPNGMRPNRSLIN